MTYLNINATTEEVLNKDGYVLGNFKQHHCYHCDETFRARKSAAADDGNVVHRRCLDGYAEALREARRIATRISDEAKMVAQRARHESTIEQRGTDMAAFASFDNRAAGDPDSDLRKDWNFFHAANRALERADETLAKFAARLTSDPSHAFEWGMDAIAASADKKVFGQIAYYFERGLSVEEIKDLTDKEVYRGARSPARSTSPISNLMEQEIVSAHVRATGRPY